MRIGTVWDIHPLVPGRKLLLGGVEIPHDRGESGHSDGDVLLHAIIDALFGALAIGDIGTHFPPSDDRWKDISSIELLRSALDLLDGHTIGNIDCTVILQRPKLMPHIDAIRNSIASVCNIPYASVSVKAKTAEGLLGELGAGNAVIAQVVVLLHEGATDTIGNLDDWV